MAMFRAVRARRRALKEPRAGFAGGRRRGECARRPRDPSELFQRKTFVIVMTGECEAPRLRMRTGVRLANFSVLVGEFG